LTGIYLPGGATHFYLGETLLGSVNDPDFGRRFFNIWLSETTTEPKLRAALLNL
jgi:hypothetical protein